MTQEAMILVNNYNLPAEFAEDFIKFTKNDIEAAIKIIESSDKDMIVLKGKFISSKKATNGVFLFFYNMQTNQPEYMFAIVSTNPNLSRIRMENSWKDLYGELTSYVTSEESRPDLSAKIETQVMQSENLQYLSSFFIDKSTIDMVNLKRYFLSEISLVLMDTGIILKLIFENIDLFRFKGFVKSTNLGFKVTSNTYFDWLILLNIGIEPVLAPLGGEDIEKVKLFDEILVKIIDHRDIVQFVTNLIDPNSKDVLYGKVVNSQKSPNTENNIVILQFGVGIFGKFIIGGKIRVQVKENTDKKTEAPPIEPINRPQYIEKKIEPIISLISEQETQKTTSENEEKAIPAKKINLYAILLTSAAFLTIVLLLVLWLFF